MAYKSFKKYSKKYSKKYKKYTPFKKSYFKKRYLKKKFVEKKYQDIALITTQVQAGETGKNGSVDGSNGVNWQSQQWSNYYFFNKNAGNWSLMTNNLIKSPGQGVGILDRIGNVITVNYVKGRITFTAAKQCTPSTEGVNQHGEALAATSDNTVAYQHLRTTIRYCIVLDKQMYNQESSSLGALWYNEVFKQSSTDEDGAIGGVHSDLRLDHLGRYKVIIDKTINIDADDPQRTVEFFVSGSDLQNGGRVRYSSPVETSCTANQSLHIIWAAFTSEQTAGINTGGSEGLTSPTVVVNSRMCFIDP